MTRDYELSAGTRPRLLWIRGRTARDQAERWQRRQPRAGRWLGWDAA